MSFQTLPSSRLRLAGNAFALLTALTPLICATLGSLMYRAMWSRAPVGNDLALRLYNPFYYTGVTLFALCLMGGLLFTCAGIAQRSRRLVWQGVCGMGMGAALWCAWAALTVYAALQFAG